MICEVPLYTYFAENTVNTYSSENGFFKPLKLRERLLVLNYVIIAKNYFTEQLATDGRISLQSAAWEWTFLK